MQHIVVGVDGSAQADRALRWAVREGELRLATVDLLHCYVVRARGALWHTSERDVAESRLDEIVDRNREILDDVKWTAATKGVVGGPSVGLVDQGEDADLIVVGSRGGGGFQRLRLGSTGYRTAAHAAAPVAVIHDDGADDTDGRRPLVVGVDGSRAAARALRWAIDEAARRNVPLTVAHGFITGADPALLSSVPEDQRQQFLTRVRDEAHEVVRSVLDGVEVRDDVEIEQVIEEGTPADVLLTRAEPGRLLVVGTRGHGVLGRVVFGSVSHQCLHHATGPVVVVP